MVVASLRCSSVHSLAPLSPPSPIEISLFPSKTSAPRLRPAFFFLINFC